MSEESLASPDDRGGLDEQRIARGVAIGLPLVTLVVAAGVGIIVGPATSILVLAAGLLLGVIGLFWSSIRILSGDAPLSPELEALDMAAQGVDALASRKKMLLRALKDLETEHSIGKIEDEDFQQISSTYRAELKAVLQRIDDSLAPHREKAEELARSYLSNVGISSSAREGISAPDPEAITHAAPTTPSRVKCPSCKASNERDAKFCKECATKLSGASSSSEEIADEA